MKKIFTLALAILGFAGAANAATVDNLSVCKHSYVLICEDWTVNGTKRPGSGTLFGDNYFLDVKGGTVATNKKGVDLSVADGTIVTEEIAAKYGEYGSHLNCLRLKKSSDLIAMKVTAKSKLFIFYQHGGNADRYPIFTKDADLKEKLEVQGVDSRDGTYGRMEWTAPDDMLVYICSYNGDMWLSYIIVEANEAPGTPTVKVGEQKYENGLWFKEVTCKANNYQEEGSTRSFPTVVTYTTDGSTPTAASTKYTDTIKCYADMVVKFQAFIDYTNEGEANDEDIADNADNEAVVSFKFDAPTLTVDGGNVTITSPYESATNYYIVSPDSIGKEGNTVTLTTSATVTAYTKIQNGTYGTFETGQTSTDVYLMNPIKEKKTITVTAGEKVLDEAESAKSTTGKIYTVKDGAISADAADFFVKSIEYGVVSTDSLGAYQVPEGQEVYIKMNNTNIAFAVAEGDSVDVVVTCTKNSCKTLNAKNDEDVTTDRKCAITVNSIVNGTATATTYFTDENGNTTTSSTKHKDVNDGGNVVKFRLGDGIHTFQKYSGTGNIFVSSIEFTPVLGNPDGISSAVATESINAPAYNLAGQKVDASYKGVVIKNGQKLIQK